MQALLGRPSGRVVCPKCGGLLQLPSRSPLVHTGSDKHRPLSATSASRQLPATPAGANGVLEQAPIRAAAAEFEEFWDEDLSQEQKQERQASSASASSSSDSSGLCKQEADIISYPTMQTRSTLKQYENARIAHRHSVMSATTWQAIVEVFDHSYGYNLYATSSALMLHRLARMRAQNMKRKRRKLAPAEELHAPKKVVQKLLNACISQARAFAPRDILAVLHGVGGLNVTLAPEQLQLLDDRAAACLPYFHERELPAYLDLRAGHKQAISAALSQALRQQWLGSSGASMPLGQAAKALPLLLPDIMDAAALSQICSKVEADAPSMTPKELEKMLISLVSLTKQGAQLPMQTVDALAACVTRWAGHWELADASTVLSCILQLAIASDGTRQREWDQSPQKASPQTAAMSSAVMEAVGESLARTNRKAGSSATLGGKRRPLSLTNVINISFQLGITSPPACAPTLLTTLQSSTLVDLSVLDVADLMKVVAVWGLANEHQQLIEMLSLNVLRNKRRASARTSSCVQHSLSLLQQELAQPGPRMQSLVEELSLRRSP